MSAWSFFYRYGLWITAPLFCVGAVLLAFFIVQLVRLGDRMRISSVPLVEQQDIEFMDTGPVVLCVEGPLLTRRFSGLTFELLTGDGIPVEGRRCWFRASSSSFSRVRTEWQTHEISYRGRYILRIRDLGAPRPSDPKHRIVFMKPHLPQTFGYIIGILLSSGLCIVSLVFFLLRLLSRE